MTIHDGKYLHILHTGKIKQFPSDLDKQRIELILRQNFFLFFIPVLGDHHSIKQWIHILNIILKLFNILLTLMIQLGECKAHVFPLEFSLLVLKIVDVLALIQVVFQGGCQFQYFQSRRLVVYDIFD